jgi:hypothetical protein
MDDVVRNPLSRCVATRCARSATCGRHADSGTKPSPYRQTFQDYSDHQWFDPDHCFAWRAIDGFKRRAEE